MSERSNEGKDSKQPEARPPEAAAKQPEAKPPEAHGHDSGRDKVQSGQHDTTAEKAASSRQFRDSYAGSLDGAIAFKRLGQSGSGQPPLDSASRGTGNSFFS